MLKTVGKANVEAPFKHWYAIVDNRCWYLGINLSVESAKEKAIKEFHVQLSKGGYCILDQDSFKTTFLSMKSAIEKDFDSE